MYRGVKRRHLRNNVTRHYEIAEEEIRHVGEERPDLRKRTKDFALRIIRLFAALDKTTESQVIGKQLLRSGTSVGANYREAVRARSKNEFIAKLGICLRELDETQYWIEILAEAEIVPANRLANLADETNQLLAIFTTISKSTKSQ